MGHTVNVVAKELELQPGERREGKARLPPMQSRERW